ncbi:hypothetical protein BKA64DRAFT_481079 [Cadophora sp. MPI-SDFR-AT-0126]|nr:hypothetical protein BKA64DRAFT_481079 [Leotiomycetes sp. MPI-SDFR-AT-0126]
MLTESARTNEIISRNTSAQDVRMKENQLDPGCMKAGDSEITADRLPVMDGLLNQELKARDVNPMKLVTSLRVRFGIGRYEIERKQNVYIIRIPRQLSEDEIARCSWN